MGSHSLRASAAVACAAVTLTGCSAAGLATSPDSTTRMTRPAVVPDVEDSATVSDQPADGSAANAAADSTSTFVDVPQQIWVRSASYATGHYTLVLATASGGRFSLTDARAVGGESAPDSAEKQCERTREQQLRSPVPGAIKNVTHLVTLVCPAPSALRLPVILGQWGDDTKGGTTSAQFALGGASAQGSPRSSFDAPVSATPPPYDFDLVSLVHTGNNLTVKAWVTEYVSLTVDTSENNPGATAFPSCVTKPPSAEKPGIKAHAPQRLFEMTCTDTPTLEGYDLRLSQGVAHPGGELMYMSDAIDLAHSRPGHVVP